MKSSDSMRSSAKNCGRVRNSIGGGDGRGSSGLRPGQILGSGEEKRTGMRWVGLRTCRDCRAGKAEEPGSHEAVVGEKASQHGFVVQDCLVAETDLLVLADCHLDATWICHLVFKTRIEGSRSSRYRGDGGMRGRTATAGTKIRNKGGWRAREEGGGADKS